MYKQITETSSSVYCNGRGVRITRANNFYDLQDCCEACKLGLISGSMGMECVFESFEFEPPWDKAYHACCLEAQPSTSLPVTVSTTAATANQENKTTVIPTPGEMSCIIQGHA
jgi:hypothetical protein